MSFNISSFKSLLSKFAYINTDDNVMNFPGNITALNVFSGGSSGSTTGNATIGPVIDADVLGNATGNYIIANTMNVSGNLSAQYFVGNGQAVVLNGFPLSAQGNVSNTAARLALNVPPGTIVTQTDTNSTYLSIATPSSVPSNWLPFSNNFPVQTVFGRTGYITSQVGDYTSSQVLTAGAIGPVSANDSISNALVYLNAVKANIINGNVTANFFGNVVASNVVTSLLTGNIFVAQNATIGTVSSNTMYAQTLSGNIVSSNVFAPFFIANVVALGNVDTSNITASNVVVLGPMFIQNANVVGNLTASRFVGGDVVASSMYAQNAQSNIVATGNVDGSNVTGSQISVGNLFVSGSLTISGNCVASNFATPFFSSAGNVLSFFVGNVVSRGNVDTTNVTSTQLRVYGNATVTGQVQVLGNVIGQNFIGSLISSGNVSAPYFVGNVISPGNVDTGNITTSSLVAGNVTVTGQVNIIGNIVSSVVVGDIQTTGNMSAVFFVANTAQSSVVQARNVTSRSMTTTNASYATETVLGNVIASFFIGNIQTSGNVVANLNGNVISRGNVDAMNVTSQTFRTGNLVVSNNVYGSIINANNFVGSFVIPGNISGASIAGTVLSQGNVDAANVTGLNLVASGLTANVVRANVVTSNMIGNTLIFLSNVQSALNGNVLSRGNVDTNILTTSSLSSTNSSIVGQVNVTGNVNVANFFGNVIANGPTFAQYYLGNVTASGNVDASNVVSSVLIVNGNAVMSGQVNVTGNVTASSFFGNIVTSGNLNGRFFGNVLSSGNVDATNITTSLLGVYGNSTINGQVNVSGVLVGNTISGNALLSSFANARSIQANVIASGNVDATNITALNVLVNGNVTVTGQVNVVGNVVASSLIGNIVTSGNVNSRFFGNVVANGNVDAANMSSNGIIVYGNATSAVMTANLILGNIQTNGNVTAPFFNANVLSFGNVDAVTVTTGNAFGNVVSAGQVNVVGNVLSGFTTNSLVSTFANAVYFLGNVNATSVATGNVTALQANVFGNITVAQNIVSQFFSTTYTSPANIVNNFVGNVSSFGNVDSANIVTQSLRTGSARILGQLVSVGNVVATTFVGNVTMFGAGNLRDSSGAALFIISPTSNTLPLSNATISMVQATSTRSGYLSSTDWSTFNAKVNLASPGFSGTVTMPTGIQVGTQAPGSIPARFSGSGSYSFTGQYGGINALSGIFNINGATGTVAYSVEFGSRVMGGGACVISDRRAKTNIENLPGNVCNERIRKLEAKSYVWDDGRLDTGPKIGWIAQEVGNVGIGEAVTTIPKDLEDGRHFEDYHVLEKKALAAVLWSGARDLALALDKYKQMV